MKKKTHGGKLAIFELERLFEAQRAARDIVFHSLTQQALEKTQPIFSDIFQIFSLFY